MNNMSAPSEESDSCCSSQNSSRRDSGQSSDSSVVPVSVPSIRITELSTENAGIKKKKLQKIASNVPRNER